MEPTKIPQAPEKTKAELFAEDPDRFVDRKSLLVSVERHPEYGVLGIAINIGREGQTANDAMQEAGSVQSFINRKMTKFVDKIEEALIKRSQATAIVKSNGKGIIDFARNGFRK